jgi:hypothetical protein
MDKLIIILVVFAGCSFVFIALLAFVSLGPGADKVNRNIARYKKNNRKVLVVYTIDEISKEDWIKYNWLCIDAKNKLFIMDYSEESVTD